MRRGDPHKCVFFLVVGVVLFFCGIPVIATGAALLASNIYADFIAYVGGITMVFGIIFVFLWYMITIPEKEKKLDLQDTKVVNQIAISDLEMIEDLSKPSDSSVPSKNEERKLSGHYNHSFESDASVSGEKKTTSASLNLATGEVFQPASNFIETKLKSRDASSGSQMNLVDSTF